MGMAYAHGHTLEAPHPKRGLFTHTRVLVVKWSLSNLKLLDSSLPEINAMVSQATDERVFGYLTFCSNLSNRVARK